VESKKLRVLTIINSLGDTGQYFIPFFEGLINRGHRLIVISTISHLMCNKLSRIGINYVDLGDEMRGLSSLQGLVRFPSILAKIMRIISDKNIDLIHVHNPFLPLLLGCIASNVKKIPIVLTIHAGPPSFSLRLNPIRQIHGIITTSLEQKEAFPKCNKEVAVIPLPIDLDRFSPNSHMSTTERRTYKKILLISSVRTSVVYSLIESAPRISEFFRNAKIIITGGYSKTYEVEKVVRKMNKEIGREMIILTGFVEDTPKIINQADIVIGVGMVVAEAMACGKPVIVAGPTIGPYGGSFGGVVNKQNVDELRKYNFTGRNSTIPTDAENIFKSVNTLLNDEQYMKYLGAFGRRYAEKEFEPDKIAMRVELVYKCAQENAKNTDNFPSLVLLGWPLLCSIPYVFINEVLTILKSARQLVAKMV
jgi:glycosyltransferase involved in cell wall biosynthesis